MRKRPDRVLIVWAIQANRFVLCLNLFVSSHDILIPGVLRNDFTMPPTNCRRWQAWKVSSWRNFSEIFQERGDALTDVCAFFKNKWGLICAIQSWQVKKQMSACSFTILPTRIAFSTNRNPSQHTHTLQVNNVDSWRTWRPSVCPVSSHSSLMPPKLPLFCPISLPGTIWLPIFLTSCFQPPPHQTSALSPQTSQPTARQ